MKKLAPNIKILPVKYTGGEPADAATAVNNVLRANSDLVGMFSTFEPSVLGTISALTGSCKSQITHIGYDADAAEVQALKAGKLDALVIQKPRQMGYDAVTQMAKVLKGTLKHSAIKYDQPTPLVLATKANLRTSPPSRTSSTRTPARGTGTAMAAHAHHEQGPRSTSCSGTPRNWGRWETTTK